MCLNFRSAIKFYLRLVLVFFLSFSLSCGASNVFENTGNRETDQALLEAGIQYINDGDYDAAIRELEKITSSFRRTPRVVKAIAGAYAGKCGMEFVQLINDIGGSSGTTPLMLLMNAFQSRVISPSDCNSAQIAIESVYGSVSAIRPTDLNFFLALLGMTKVGTYLRSIADADQDGAVDVTFTNACTDDDDNITDDEVKQVGSGMGLILDNITAITAAVSGSDALDALETLAGLCGASCTITDPNDAGWDAATVKVMRSVVAHEDFGIMTCNDPTLVGCCP
jgi:hypothetical protein